MKLALRKECPKFIAHSERMKARREKYHQSPPTNPAQVTGKYIPAGEHKNIADYNY